MVSMVTRADVRRVLDFPMTIDAVEAGFGAQPAATVPTRIQFDTGNDGEFLVMAGELGDPPTLGLKAVSLFPDNDARDVPRILGTIMLFDPETGAVDAILDGTDITNYRTGAIGAVAARYLAPTEVRTVGVIGSGTQARYQVRALDAELSVDRFEVYSRSKMKHEAVAELEPRIDASIEAVGDASTACAGSGIVVAATTSPTPVYDDGDLEPGCLVIGVGSNSPSMRELPGETMARASRVFVDEYDLCLEVGDIADAISEGRLREVDIARMSDLVTGRIEPSPPSDDVTVVKSVGTVVLDLAVAVEVLASVSGRDGDRSIGLQGIE